jgi:hypothetical protein
MNTKTIAAVLLITLGIVVLAYSGISFTTPGKTIDFLGMHIATSRRRAHARWRNHAAARETQERLTRGVEP